MLVLGYTIQLTVDGNDKKAYRYWSGVTSTYNNTAKCNRMKNRNQLKLHWERINKPVTDFNGCYTRITKVHQSGMSVDQKMDQAMQLYASEHNEKPFIMLHVWRILRYERKWATWRKLVRKRRTVLVLTHNSCRECWECSQKNVLLGGRRPKKKVVEKGRNQRLLLLLEKHWTSSWKQLPKLRRLHMCSIIWHTRS